MRPVPWTRILLSGDVDQLWSEIYLLSSYPLDYSLDDTFITSKRVPASGSTEAYHLAQLLLLRLLELNRFQYYLDLGFTDSEIDDEIRYVEVSKVLEDCYVNQSGYRYYKPMDRVL